MSKMPIFRRLVGASLVAMALAGTSPAKACCGDGEIAAGGSLKAGLLVKTTIEASVSMIGMWLERINTTLGIGFGKIVAEIMKQTAAMRVMQEGQIAANTHMYMEKVRADAMTKYELSPRACYEIASGAAGAVANDTAASISSGLSEDFAKRTLFTANATAAVGKAYTEHVEKYCSQQDADLGRCSRPAAPELQNADVRADVTLTPSSYNSQQMQAARSFVNNVTNPIPTQNIPKDWEKTSQGRMFVAGQYIEQARASVAAHSLNSAIAARTRIQGLGASAMLNRDDVSQMELMESQVRGRFESPTWYKMLAGLSPENIMREIAKITAYKAWAQYQDYRQTERIEILLATQLAMDVKRDAEERLREARQAVAKAAR